MDTPKLDALLNGFEKDDDGWMYYGLTVPAKAAVELAALKARCAELLRAVEKRDAVLSRIDYLLDDRPNDRDVSYYDLHGDPETVQKRFETNLADLKSELVAWREFAWHQTWCRECGETSPRQCSEGFALWEKADPTITKEVD